MPIAPQATIDPLSAFMTGAFVAGTANPCPLVATRFDVVIDAGLAVVTMSRAFRNAEADSIEATITFPVPVHAALFALELRIGERVLKARAARKQTAREDYEAALDRGKTAVLHEEVLRGVHMLSVSHIPPGAQIEVRATFVMPLINVEGRGRLRIPLTVGDVYGRSGLSDSDDLIHGGPLQNGTLHIDCRDGKATLLGGDLNNGQTEIALNVPIEIDVIDWTPRVLPGRAADGRAIALRIAPYAGSDTPIDIAMLVDHSGSMGERCSTLQGGLTKHSAAVAALAALDRQIGQSDTIDLWEFDNDLRHVGSTRTGRLRELVQQLDGPDGGTEIGLALEGVLSRSGRRDILLITNGKSHALDVQALARSGRHFFVVLVGADSLEAHVGHLAALTGGELFVAAGPDLTAMVDAAIRSLRRPHTAPQRTDSALCERRAGMELTVRWSAAGGADASTETIEAHAVAALSASLLIPTLSEDAAAALAEAEGLVTHLTSLFLVDEDAAAQPSIPGTRKIALATPATAFDRPWGASRLIRRVGSRRQGLSQDSAVRALKSVWDGEIESRRSSAACQPPDEQRLKAEAEICQRVSSPADAEHGDELSRSRRRPPRADLPPEAKPKAKTTAKFKVETRRAKRSLSQWYKELFGQTTPPSPELDIAVLSARIDWDNAPQRLLAGDLSNLDAAVGRAVRALATEPVIVREARQFGCTPLMLAIGLLARLAAPRNRTAERIARTILADRPTDGMEAQLTRYSREAVPA
ncbi:MAG: VIT domain-containing protein [Xanthobacteraceae bacterium]